MEQKDFEQLTNNESSFIKILRSFDFLRSEGYKGNGFTIYSREAPNVEFVNLSLNQKITVFWSEENGKYDVVFSRKKSTFFGVKTVEFSIQDFVSNKENAKNILELPLGETNILNSISSFVQTHLMPVVRGEKWVDELE